MTYAERLKELKQGAMVQTPMPQYQCHKKVWALKIAGIEHLHVTFRDLEALDPRPEPDQIIATVITPAESGYAPFGVSDLYMKKHNPQVGGYYVVYEDGYKSFSPTSAFEGGYTLIR